MMRPIDKRAEDMKERLVLDVIFVGVTILFFGIAVGYVVVCERLMD